MPCGSSIKHDVYITAFMFFFFIMSDIFCRCLTIQCQYFILILHRLMAGSIHPFFSTQPIHTPYHTSCKFILIQHPAQRKTFNKRGPTLIRTKSGAVIGKLNWGDGILLIELAAREKRNCQFRTMSLCDIERLRRGKKVKRKKREVREAER